MTRRKPFSATEELRKRGHQVTLIGAALDEGKTMEDYVGLKHYKFPIFESLIEKEGFNFATTEIDKMYEQTIGMPFAIKVMEALNDACAKWKAETDIDFSLYGTPLESTTYKFAKTLQNRFGIIKDVTDHNYITNSYHCNVREDITAFDKLYLEAKFQKLSPGGYANFNIALNSHLEIV